MHTHLSWRHVAIFLTICLCPAIALRCYSCVWSSETVPLIDNEQIGIYRWCAQPTEEHLPRPDNSSSDNTAPDGSTTDGNRADGNMTYIDVTDGNITDRNHNETSPMKTKVCATVTVRIDILLTVINATVRTSLERPSNVTTDLLPAHEICKPGKEIEIPANSDPFLQFISKMGILDIKEVCICNYNGCNNRTAAGSDSGIFQPSPGIVTLLLLLPSLVILSMNK